MAMTRDESGSHLDLDIVQARPLGLREPADHRLLVLEVVANPRREQRARSVDLLRTGEERVRVPAVKGGR